MTPTEQKKICVGIVIPTFNSSKTITETIDSLKKCNALYESEGVFVADDHSKDDTLALIKKSWPQRLPLHIFDWPVNVGERANINRTLDQIQNQLEWFLILHSDDLVSPDWILEMLERIRKCSEKTASICSSWDVLNEDGTMTPGENLSGVRVVSGGVESTRSTFQTGCWWHISGCAIRVKAFNDIGKFNPDMPQLGDFEWVIRCLLKGWDIEFIPRSLIRYRSHAESVSSASFRTDRDIKEFLMLLRDYRGILLFSARCRLHWCFVIRCLRRAVRSFLRGHVNVCFRRIILSFKVACNFFR